ncbi:MAG: hypothetical protein JW822_14110 [Spirochaetales bacterium]|nr:hypothetical protein [Spirochaetales bacterium]
MKIKAVIKQHSVLVYFVLAFLISWGLAFILAGPENIPANAEKYRCCNKDVK